MRWQLGSDRKRLSLREAERFDVLGRTLSDLGLPKQGALLVGRSGDAQPARILLR